MSDITTREAERAFLGLLARPLVTPHTDAELHRRVLRHRKHVTDAARRLGYRLQTVGRAVRLQRIPVAGMTTAPPAPLDLPARRVLSLACAMAAACEEADGGVTLQRLSDLVRDLTSGPGTSLAAYDPDSMAQRRQLVRAAAVLEHWGVLRRRSVADRLLEDWAESGAGVGAGYDIDREALLLLAAPDVLALALDAEPPTEEQLSATRSMRALRALVETSAVLYADLDPADAESLRGTRGLRASEVAAMTGGTVEARREGLMLLLPDDDDCPVTVDWPKAAAVAWLALVAADLAGRAGERREDGTVLLTSHQADAVIEDLIDWRGEYLSKSLREAGPGGVRSEAERQLRHLGLLRCTSGGGWVLSPVAARYRDPDITVAPAEAS